MEKKNESFFHFEMGGVLSVYGNSPFCHQFKKKVCVNLPEA